MCLIENWAQLSCLDQGCWPISQIMETPVSTEEERVVRTLAYTHAKDKMSNVLDMCKFNIKITIIT